MTHGVHRPLDGGILGRDNEEEFSIVLSGGYEDGGHQFLYTGSGGRDLSVEQLGGCHVVVVSVLDND